MSPILDSIGSVKGYGWGSFSQSVDFQLIAATVLGSNTTTVSFSNISQGYSHLVVMGGTRISNTNTNGGFAMRYNSSTANTGNEIRQTLYKITSTSTYGDSSGGSTTQLGVGGAGNSSNANTFGYFRVFIPTYKQTDKYRGSWIHSGYDTNTVNNGALDDALLRQTVNQIPSSTALSSIQFYSDDVFMVGSHFALYGVK